MNPPPRKPDGSECCGSGCQRCVFDIYEEECKIWRRKNASSELGKKIDSLLCSDSYTELVITKIERLSCDTKLFTLSDLAQCGRIHTFELGEHVIVKDVINGETACRPYTPIEESCDRANLHLVIKLYEDGLMSSLIKSWEVGRKVECRGPSGDKVEYACNKWEVVVLVSAGTGITPMIKVIQKILGNEEEETDVILFFACRKYEDILLKDKIDQWTDYWNFHVFYFLSQESEEDVKSKRRYKEKIFCRRMEFKDFKQLRWLAHSDNSRTFSFICGPTSFETDARQHLLKCGIKPCNMHTF